MENLWKEKMNNNSKYGKNVGLILAGGRGSRVGAKVEKQLLYIDSKPMIVKTVEAFLCVDEVEDIVLVCPMGKTAEYRKLILRYSSSHNINIDNLHFVDGGNTRQESSFLGVQYIYKNFEEDLCILIHDGARPYVSKEIIINCIIKTWKEGNALTCVKPKDTIRSQSKTLNRDELYLVQTPQAFKKDSIYEALKKATDLDLTFTDDASCLEHFGERINLVEGSYENIKITTREDIPYTMRVGSGFDVHKLEEGRDFILGGVKIESPLGMVAHSDGDVLVHSIMDALLGGAAMGDIGRHFPDTDEEYRGISSMELLKRVNEMLHREGWEIVNIDATVVCEKPKISPYVDEIRENISRILNIDINRINIKATTTEKLGYIGRREGIASESTCLLQSRGF